MRVDGACPKLLVALSPSSPVSALLQLTLVYLFISLSACSSGNGSAVPGMLSISNPNTLYFPDTPVGSSSAPQTVTLSIMGDTEVQLYFDNSIMNGFTYTTTCGPILKPGHTCTVTFVFEPQYVGGYGAANGGTDLLVIDGNLNKQPNFSSVSVGLNGTATAAVARSVALAVAHVSGIWRGFEASKGQSIVGVISSAGRFALIREDSAHLIGSISVVRSNSLPDLKADVLAVTDRNDGGRIYGSSTLSMAADDLAHLKIKVAFDLDSDFAMSPEVVDFVPFHTSSHLKAPAQSSSGSKNDPKQPSQATHPRPTRPTRTTPSGSVLGNPHPCHRMHPRRPIGGAYEPLPGGSDA